MSDDGFDWHGDDADESSSTDRDEERVGDDETESAGTPGDRGVSDRADAPPDGRPAEREPRDEDAPSGPRTFEGLIDRIGESEHAPDVDVLRDLVPADAAVDDPAEVGRLLDRADGDAGWPSGGKSSAEPPAGGGTAGSGDADSTPDDAAGGAGDSPAADEPKPVSPDTASPELPDDVPGDTPADDGTGEAEGSSGSAPTNPFEDLVSRIDAERRSTVDRRGTSGAVDPAEVPSDATNVLLLSSLDTDEAFESCLSMIGEHPPSRTNLLFVWLTRDVEHRLARLYDSYADPSTTVTVVCRSEIRRSLLADPSIPTDEPGSKLSIHRISDPRDLPKLGIAINRVFSEWRGRPNRPVMCFHSITDLLQFEDHERVFRFLHVLGGRINSVEATAYYQLDPGAHDEKTVSMFRNLFDATVDLTNESTAGDG